MHSPFWLQLACDLLSRDLWTTGTKNDSTMGAVLVALQSVGGDKAQRHLEPTVVCSRLHQNGQTPTGGVSRNIWSFITQRRKSSSWQEGRLSCQRLSVRKLTFLV